LLLFDENLPHLTPAVFSGLPYGVLCDPETDEFLFRPTRPGPAIQFARIQRWTPPRSLRLRKPLRVLLAAAEAELPDVPSRLSPLLDQLAHDLTGTVELFVCTPREFEPVHEYALRRKLGRTDYCRTTREGLRSALATGVFDVLHLLAHTDGQRVLLCDAEGRTDILTGEELAQWCGAGGLQMAFLQVGGTAREGEGIGDLARQLLSPDSGNLGAVVASRVPLDGEDVARAAVLFYDRLARGFPLQAALDRGQRLPLTNWAWAFLELWARPGVLGETSTQGPYRGLAPFEERDAALFFGRDAEVHELWRLLNDEPAVAVVGDAGSGKSSLLRAGLVPAVRQRGLAGVRRWDVIVLRPGSQPATSLLAALRGPSAAAAEPSTSDEDRLSALIAALPDSWGPLLIVFDQFEEMFTLCRDEVQRRATAAALAELVRRNPRSFRLALGVRSDYLGASVQIPELVPLLRRPWVLWPPGLEALRDIVTRPAASAGYTFEGPLVERILGDLPSTAGSLLPLLQFSLEALWRKAVERGSREFTLSDYDELGGLGGAIGRHAEEVFARLPGAQEQALARRIFLGLIGARGNLRRRPRAEVAAETGDPPLAQRVIDHLVDQRLLTLSSDPSNPGLIWVEIIHEMLLDRWPRLRSWAAQDPESRAPDDSEGGELVFVNGVDGSTGNYLLPPLPPAVLAAAARGEPLDESRADWLRGIWERLRKPFL
jgi:hypothetical protein